MKLLQMTNLSIDFIKIQIHQIKSLSKLRNDLIWDLVNFKLKKRILTKNS